VQVCTINRRSNSIRNHGSGGIESHHAQLVGVLRAVVVNPIVEGRTTCQSHQWANCSVGVGQQIVPVQRLLAKRPIEELLSN